MVYLKAINNLFVPNSVWNRSPRKGKMKKQSSKSYELTFILADGLTEDKEEEVLGEIKDKIQEVKGEVLEKEDLGLKQLAYPIKKNQSGHYFSFILNLPTNSISELERELRFIPEILRHLLILKLRFSEQQLKGNAQTKEAQVEAPKVEKTATAKAAPKEEESVEDKKTRQEKLEKKLEEILKE